MSTFDPHALLKGSIRGTPAPPITGKRKRPTGEATFDVPDSPPLPTDIDAVLSAENEQPQKVPRVDEEVDDGDADAVDAETALGSANVLNSMEANGEALQKRTVKKRKKRKSIGQQAPRRAKAKVSPTHREATKEVKGELMSPSAQAEGESRLSAVPADGEDPAEAQIRYELAGAAEEGLRDSLIGDTELDASNTIPNSKRRSTTPQTRQKKPPMPSKILSEGDELRTDPQIYSLPASTPVSCHVEDADGVQEGKGDGEGVEEGGDGADEESVIEDKGQVGLQKPNPAKPKRKKRKSIGQQKPKRPSTGGSSKKPVTNQKAAPNHFQKQPKPKSKAPPATARKRQHSYPKPATASKPREPPANTVPITMYRPPPKDDAAEATQNESSNSDHDPLTDPLPPPPHTLNAIDVLSQVTRELVAKTASNPQLSSRSQNTMRLYGQELEGRMNQLGQALATNAALGKRVRRLNAEEKGTRREVEEVVSEREGVRERIQEATGLQRGMRLGTLLARIAGWAKRGWEREAAGKA